jgi:hypothetical protein
MSPSARLNWLPVLQTLTRDHPDWSVCKHLDAALGGRGDVDGMASLSSVERISESIALALANVRNGGVMLACDHVPGIRLHFIFIDHCLPRVEQIDTYWLMFRKAYPWGRPEHMSPLAVYRDGVRTLPPEAEALIDLIFSIGTSRMPAQEQERRLDSFLSLPKPERDELLQIGKRMLPTAFAARLEHYLQVITADRSDLRRANKQFERFVLFSSIRYPRHLISRTRFTVRAKCSLGLLGETGRRFDGTADQALSKYGSGHLAYQL